MTFIVEENPLSETKRTKEQLETKSLLCRAVLCFIGRSLLIQFMEFHNQATQYLSMSRLYMYKEAKQRSGFINLNFERLMGVIKVTFFLKITNSNMTKFKIKGLRYVFPIWIEGCFTATCYAAKVEEVGV